MKKFGKVLCVIVAILSLACCLLVSACNANCNVHTHTWREWQMSATEHWHVCSSCGAEQRENHSMISGECSVCGYKLGQHTHTWGEWQMSATEHWRVCASGDAEQRGIHTFKDGACSVCGYVENMIPGLIFSIADNGTGYSVASDKTFAQTSVNIPSYYLGKPVVELVSGAFRNNKNLVSVKLPETLKKIGASAFAGCTALLNIDIPSSVQEIDSLTFSGCTNLSSVQLHKGLKVIKNNAFERCGLTSVNVPEGVTSIGYNAFCDCKMLSVVKFPTTLVSLSKCLLGTSYYDDPKNWYDNVLYVDGYCLAVKMVNGSAPNTITVKSGTTLLADSVFNDSSIKTVVLPMGLKYIGEMAFNIAGISTINIPSSVIKIGAKAFAGCKSLTSITGGSATYTVKDNCIIERTTKKLIAVCKNCIIPTDGAVQTIGSGVFSNMGISSIVLPASVTAVEDGAFSFTPFGGISTIFYLGDADEFARISVGEDNGDFTEGKVYYYSVAEPQKTPDGSAYNGRYWYYDGSTPKKWVIEN